MKIFLVEGHDGETPLQAYCSVMTPSFMIVDSIFPHPNISICVGKEGVNEEFGDNDFTRNVAIRELIELDRSIHGVKHFFHRYKAVLKTYIEIEQMEYQRFEGIDFDSIEERCRYFSDMNSRLKRIFIRYLKKTIPEVPITEDSDLIIQPYLLSQILKYVKF